MSDSIRIGIAGGRFGQRHAEALNQVDGVSLVAVADRDETVRNSMLDTFKFEQSFDSYQEMIQSGILDAIVVCLPPEFHERAVNEAFDNGLHVLCELPPAVSASEMSRIVSAAGFCGKVYMWSNEQRFSPELQTARSMVQSGALGAVYRGEAAWHWGWPSFDAESDWRGSIERKGGALLSQGIHVIDSLWFAMGCPDPVEAMAARHNLRLRDSVSDPTDAAEDSAFGMIRFKDGASISYSSMLYSHLDAPLSDWNAPVARELKVFGAQATLDLAKGEKIQTSPSSQSVATYADLVSESALRIAQAQEFVDAIREEREPLNNGQQGLTLMKMIDALAESGKEKKAVSIKSARSLDDLFGGL